MKLKTKRFDCVEMKNRCQDMANARMKGMTPSQQLAYWNRIYQQMVRRRKKLTATLPKLV